MSIIPAWMQNVAYSARIDRSLITSLWDEGVMGLASFRVTQHTPSADLSIDVSTGRAIVTGDDQPNQGRYHITGESVANPAISGPPGSDSRYDLVVLRVRDPDAGGSAGNDAIIEVLTGTPSGTPAVPAVPASAIPLARIGPITPGMGAILDEHILDLRPIAGFRDTPGTIKAYSGPLSRIPTGWLLCDGTDQSRITYPDLHEAYRVAGYPFGSGNGSTTFGIPDARGRVLVAQGTGVFATIGATGGVTETTLTADHLPAHTHTLSAHTHAFAHTHTIAHTHSTPAHTHTFSGTTNTGAANHQHPADVADPLWRFFQRKSTGGSVALGVVAGTEQWRDVYTTDSATVSAHDHPFSGTTASGGSGTTGAASNASSGAASPSSTSGPSTANTGSTGNGSTAVSALQPFIVIGGYIVRT